MNKQISKEEYENACKEVLEILKFVKEEDLKKIPKEEIEIIKKNANLSYEITYNPNKDIKEQNISKVAKAIIANYFVKYIASSEQKQKVLAIQHKKIEEKNAANSINNNFKVEEKSTVEIKDLVEIKKEKWYEKVYQFLKKIMKKDEE